MTPISNPPASASGIERKRANTTAGVEMRTTVVNTGVLSVKIGASRTPARPARKLPSIQDVAEVRSGSMPRSAARPRRSTTARIRSPSRVRRSSTHRPTAVTTAAAKTATWLLSSRMVPTVQVCFGDGPSPGIRNSSSIPAMPRWNHTLSRSATNRQMPGTAISRPTGTTIFTATEA